MSLMSGSSPAGDSVGLQPGRKVAELPRPLTTDGAPAGDDPDINDIGYYAPSRSLVFYYGDVGYWNGVVRIGRLSDRATQLIEQQPAETVVMIEHA